LTQFVIWQQQHICEQLSLGMKSPTCQQTNENAEQCWRCVKRGQSCYGIWNPP